MMESKLNIGIIGTGKHGSRYAAHIIKDVPNMRLAAISRRSKTGREQAQQWNCVWHREWEALVDDPAVDAVISAVPPALNRRIAEACSASEKPLLMEKPLSVTAADARAIVSMFRERGVPLTVGQTLRYNPVVQGFARARQDIIGGDKKGVVLPLLIHGDAAFAGQGVVTETLNMSQIAGYKTGGTIHLIINNQIGYTTLPENARSTRYATDVAKMLMVPIFHVHGEDPEAAVHVVRLAAEYREAYNKDVVVDVICYRRYGHNEGDEPYFTQPLMYERIKERPVKRKQWPLHRGSHRDMAKRDSGYCFG